MTCTGRISITAQFHEKLGTLKHSLNLMRLSIGSKCSSLSSGYCVAHLTLDGLQYSVPAADDEPYIGITASEKTITVIEVRCHKGVH